MIDILAGDIFLPEYTVQAILISSFIFHSALRTAAGADQETNSIDGQENHAYPGNSERFFCLVREIQIKSFPLKSFFLPSWGVYSQWHIYPVMFS